MSVFVSIEEARQMTVHRDIAMAGRVCAWQDCRNYAGYAVRLEGAAPTEEVPACTPHMDDVRLHLVDTKDVAK